MLRWFKRKAVHDEVEERFQWEQKFRDNMKADIRSLERKHELLVEALNLSYLSKTTQRYEKKGGPENAA